MDRIAPTLRPTDRKPVMRQLWRELLFLHWPIAPERIQPLLSEGLTVDTFEGDAYVGLVPFTMRGVRPCWAPAVPGLSNFHEINVRTYVHRNGDDPGVWFFSLDAANSIAVTIARLMWQLPYYNAQISMRTEAARTIYHSKRKAGWGGDSSAHAEIIYAPSGEVSKSSEDSLEFFLVERYLLYAAKHNELWRGQVHHSPYPLQSARLDTLEDTLMASAGILVPSSRPLVHYAKGVDVDIFPLEKL